ncbi:hypothetical protein N7481_002935 [Penicillium waksmanii]|uniref:uncharacterized protein n=1 Tax=Penicillium waksmanii TaxID=69791 RepID=UPI00254681E5|nr:uncharacterized protein N7481_002935 [Penicillium waksmanii]KAJ5987725.1 hypothetical protein N7481_002935 [Penicillium waksmanii]
MQFSIAAIAVAFASLAAAMPTEFGMQQQEGGAVRYPVPSDMTVKQAQSKCGNQAQLSCCNRATYAHDTTNVNKGLGAGLLSHLIGTGSGAEGVGIFRQCSKLDVQVDVTLIPIQDLLNQHCKQNIACCVNSPSSASSDLVGAGLPCIALGSIL